MDATNNYGGGPQSGKQGENPVSSLGHLRKVFPGLNFDKKCLHFQQMFGKVVSLQCNMPIICVESGWSDLQMEHKSQDGKLSRMLHEAFSGNRAKIPYPTWHLYNEQNS